MKIAQIIGTFPPLHGGMGYICYHNAIALAEKGHDVTVFTLHYDGVDYSGDPGQIRIIRLKTPLKYGDAGMLPQLFGKLDAFDVVHLHYPFFGAAEYIYLAAILKGKQYFLTYHMDVYGDTAAKKAVIGIYEPLLLEKIIRKAAAICSPGNRYLKSTKAGRFVPWEKVTAVGYGGVDISRFHPRPKNPELLKQYGLEGKKTALFVGNLIPFKGLDLLIEAISRIPDPDTVLLVVGGGYHEQAYKNQVKQLGLEKRVVFAGPQSPDDGLPEHYNLGDFLVLPSTHSESFGLVILEAMACGKPAIVSSLPGPSQLVRHGRDGLVTTAGSVEDLKYKIKQITVDMDHCWKMGDRARKKVIAEYTWEQIGEELEREFKKMAQQCR